MVSRRNAREKSRDEEESLRKYIRLSVELILPSLEHAGLPWFVGHVYD
jgi:hypothetical protein